MVIWGMLLWWYTEGWHQCVFRVKERLESTADYFSIGLLLKTLFAPFRQISAGNVRGPLNMQVRAFFDRLISRCIGMVVRLIMIGVGSAVLLLHLVAGGIIIASWAFVPLLPLIGMLLFASGWIPWSI